MNSNPFRRPPATLCERLTHLAVNGLVFGLSYSWTNWLAMQKTAAALAPDLFGHPIPFLPWMVLPYLSSGLAFILVFMVTAEPRRLWLLTQRTLLVTAFAAVCFTLIPLRFPLPRPIVESALPAASFAWLSLVDRPFNQLPSLHVAYAILFWPYLQAACRTVWQRLFAATWLLLVIASAMLTWQHTLPDLVAGAALGGAALWLLPRPLQGARAVCLFYGLAGLLVLVLLGRPLGSWICVWFGTSLLLVSLAYARRDANFLRKRDGRHPPWVQLCYLPYLAGYLFAWHLVRYVRRARAPSVQWAPRLWAGRRLGATEIRALPQDCYVIDLTCELSEIPTLRGERYLHMPMLDLHAPSLSVLRKLRSTINTLHRQGHPVFVHCAMGLSRSRLVARIATRKTPNEPVDLPA